MTNLIYIQPPQSESKALAIIEQYIKEEQRYTYHEGAKSFRLFLLEELKGKIERATSHCPEGTKQLF
jgi:hypothetical protein